MKSLKNKIVINPNICNGKPTIKGTRITVYTILEFLGTGESIENILNNYPSLNEDDIKACLLFAAEIMNKNYMIKPVA